MKQPTPLQKIHLEAIEKIDKLIDSLPFNEKKTAKQAKRANVQILYKLGWREPKTSSPAPIRRNPFKKVALTAGEKKNIASKKIDNSNAPKSPFKKKLGAKKKAKAIDNSSAPKDPFKKTIEPIIPTAKTKEGKKFNGRLSKERKLAI
ncbi:MAG: hypothetical protein ACYSTZ_09595, partial [Planctomycetota bacterium]